MGLLLHVLFVRFDLFRQLIFFENVSSELSQDSILLDLLLIFGINVFVIFKIGSKVLECALRIRRCGPFAQRK